MINFGPASNKNSGPGYILEAVNSSVEVTQKKRKSTAGPVGTSKKSLNLTGTLPKDVFNLNVGI